MLPLGRCHRQTGGIWCDDFVPEGRNAKKVQSVFTEMDASIYKYGEANDLTLSKATDSVYQVCV